MSKLEEPVLSMEETEYLEQQDRWSMENNLTLFIRTDDSHFFVVQLPHNHFWDLHQSIGVDLRHGAQFEEMTNRKVYIPMGEEWLTEKTKGQYVEEELGGGISIYYKPDDAEFEKWWDFLTKRGGE